LAHRLQHQQTNTKLDRPHKVFHLSNDIKDRNQEYCLGLYLNGRQELLKKKTIAIGGLNSNYPDFRQILAPAITLPASNLILVHNHPSGDPRPSRSDLQLTEKIQHAAELIGVSLVDHIIVASQEFYSFKRGGLLG
jgi:DNA repair protein RadC